MELKEVDQKKVNNLMFKRIGVDVPVLSKSETFSSNQLPARGLAVSNRFGYTFYAHSRGFSVAKTADLLQLAKADGIKTAQATGTVTVSIPSIRILALSSNELTVGVCAGGNVMFHELATLVHKSDTRPFEVRMVDSHDDTYAKDFSWSPSNSESYLILTSQGHLLLGHIGSALECKVKTGVVAASWSPDGQHIAYVVNNHELHITTSTFSKTFQQDLPAHLSDEDNDSDLHVDAIRWVRQDSIVVGYVRVNSEGEEDEYPLFVLSSRSGNLAQVDSNLLGLVFYQLFPSIDSFVVPSGSGPYMLADYVKPWEVVVAASRKSIDDHIVLMGWFPEDGRHVLYSLELGNDMWIPRIELQESSEDNAILGLAIDRTTVQIHLPDPTDESGDSMLPPCPVLICLTLEGKLSFFSFARLNEKFPVPDLVTPLSNVPDAKRSVPQVSSQIARAQDTSTAIIPFSPPVLKVEEPHDVRPSPNLIAQARMPPGDGTEEPPKQNEIATETKGPAKDDRDSLFERLTRASPSFSQGAASGRPAEISQAGLTPISQDIKKATSIPISSSTAMVRDLTGSTNVASTFQGLFRPFDDESKPALATVKSAPPQTQWGSQFQGVTLSLSVTSSASLQSSQIGRVPTSVASSGSLGKGLQGASTTTPTSMLSPAVKGQSGAPKLVFSQRGGEKFTPGSHSRIPLDHQPPARAPGVTDMEAAFIAELDEATFPNTAALQCIFVLRLSWN